MGHKHTSILPEGIIKAVSHDQLQHQSHDVGAIPLPAVTVAISRQAGALGTTIARELGNRLNWKVYDHELLERIAQDMNVDVDLIKMVDERHVPWLLERTEEFTATPYVSESAYIRRLMHTVLALGSHGQCVIVGRGAANILPPSTTLRVRLVARKDDRVQRIMRQENLSISEAERRLKELDNQRQTFLKDHFHFDPNQPDGYDLVINTSRMSLAEAVDVIVAALRAREQERDRLVNEAIHI